MRSAGLPAPVCVEWADLIQNPELLQAFDACDLVRIDSFGEDQHVGEQLIRRGATRPAGPPLLFGEVRHIDTTYRGLSELLNSFHTAKHRWSNSPSDIVTMFDKWESHRQLANSTTRPATHLLTEADRHRPAIESLKALDVGDRVFVKPRYGSSASGVCAIERCRHGHRVIAPIEIADFDAALGRRRLFNSLRIRSYTDPDDIETILRPLIAEHVVVESWIPKAELDGRKFDLRIVVIAGKARHTVIRASRYPMTNLHLGNKRGDSASFRRRFGNAAKQACETMAERAAACFEDSLVVGVDVLLDVHLEPFIVEVNAFGDLLPGIVNQGQSTSEACVEAMIATVTQTRTTANT